MQFRDRLQPIASNDLLFLELLWQELGKILMPVAKIFWVYNPTYYHRYLFWEFTQSNFLQCLNFSRLGGFTIIPLLFCSFLVIGIEIARSILWWLVANSKSTKATG